MVGDLGQRPGQGLLAGDSSATLYPGPQGRPQGSWAVVSCQGAGGAAAGD